MPFFFQKTQDDHGFFIFSLCGDQLGCGECLSAKYEWTFIVVYKQNDCAKCMSTTPTFQTSYSIVQEMFVTL